MANSKQIVYLSQAQYAELIANGSITVDGVTVTYDENDIYVTPQAEPVTDVRVAGTSITSNGVADIPIATSSSLGTVKVPGLNGLTLDTNGNIGLSRALVKNDQIGNSATMALTPSSKATVTFYGLAQAAGDNSLVYATPVGEYTDSAKGAIQQMLGVSDLIATAENNLVASKAYAIGDVFTANGKLYKVTSAIAADGAIVLQNDGETVSGANAVETKVGEGFPHDVRINGESIISDGVANIPFANANNGGGIFRFRTGRGLVMSTDGYMATNVTDVQINGTTIIDGSGVANIPILSQENVGVAKVANQYGIGANTTNGTLLIQSADSNLIKAPSGTPASYKPIVPIRQHESVFYGLAKAAGDTTQSASSNAVGVYTDNAKAAIKNMLGITQTLTVTVLTQDNITVTGQTVTVRAGSSEGEVYATAAYEGQPVSFSLPTGFQFYVSVSDTLNHHFNPTTARGVIKDANVAVTLQYSDFSTIKTATDIKAALNAGMDLTDLVGEQITCTKSDETLTWDVVDYDSTNKRITLLLHDAFGTANMVFEPVQALIWCENGLAAGSYTFTWNTTQCYFTLTTAIPAGGQLRANNTNFWTYESQDATATLETGTVSTDAISGATDLGHEGQGLLNHRDRVNYGSNNFAESALYWWLNSDAPANTKRTPVTKFSRAHSYSQPGFLNGLDANFIAALDDTTWLCACNNVYECPESLGGYTKGKGQTYTVTSKIGLASEMEIFGSYGGNQDGSTIYDLYNGAEATDRIKYRGTSAQIWWLRSPYWSSTYYERYVYSSGTAINFSAYYSYAVVPACQISKTAE